MNAPRTYDEAVARKAKMIADVRFWYEVGGVDAPSDETIWRAWREVLAERDVANSLDVARYLNAP